jgi:cysteine synthase A
MKIYNSIAETIGRTPLVRTPFLSKGLKGDVVFKLESFNPMSSVKDRIALSMIEDALARGAIKTGTTVIEPTSGNTGIGLAFICAAKRIPLILTMPETMSMERRKILTALGAKLVLTEGAKGMKGAIAKADELHKATPNSMIPPTRRFTEKLRRSKYGRIPEERWIFLSPAWARGVRSQGAETF